MTQDQPGQLEQSISEFVDYYNNRRYHERSYCRNLVTEGSGGGLSLGSDKLDPVGELYPEMFF